MADTVAVRWIYPPNYDENPPGAGEDRFSQTHGFKRVVVNLTNTSDSTGESAVTKIRLSDLLGPSGQPVLRTVIEKIEYHTEGMGAIILWERDPANIVAARIPEDESGCMKGDRLDPGGGDDGTGNILLTTTNAASGDTYDITLTVRLKENAKR